MKQIIGFISTFLLSLPVFAISVNHIIDKKLPKAYVSFVAKPCSGGKSIASRNANKYMMPASVTKLYTAIASLKVLPKDFTFKTKLFKSGDDYYLQFSGDPSLTHQDVFALLSVLQKSRVKQLKGHFFIDDSAYKKPDYPESLSYEDLPWYYAAPVGAVIIDENALSYRFKLPTNAYQRLVITPLNPDLAKYIHLTTDIKIVDKNQAKNHCKLHVAQSNDNHIHMYGCMKKRKNARILNFSIPNPRRLIEEYVTKVLLTLHIHAEKSVSFAKTPKNAELLASIESPVISDLVKHMLYVSDNVYANSLTKQLGLVKMAYPSFKQGTFVIRKQIAELISEPIKNIHLSDGEGNRYNLVTAEQVNKILQRVYQDKTFFSQLLKLLPQSGTSGNLEFRMNTPKLKGQVFAKTGGMHDVFALAGYIYPNAPNCKLFTLIANNITGNVYSQKLIETEILETI